MRGVAWVVISPEALRTLALAELDVEVALCPPAEEPEPREVVELDFLPAPLTERCAMSRC
jgi:hypothetical protein